jgi:hypothetical protein
MLAVGIYIDHTSLCLDHQFALLLHLLVIIHVLDVRWSSRLLC